MAIQQDRLLAELSRLNLSGGYTAADYATASAMAGSRFAHNSVYNNNVVNNNNNNNNHVMSAPMAVPMMSEAGAGAFGYGGSPPAACPVFFMSPRSAAMMAASGRPNLHDDSFFARAPACSPENGPLAAPAGFCASALMQKLSLAMGGSEAAARGMPAGDGSGGAGGGYDSGYYGSDSADSTGISAGAGAGPAVWQDGGLYVGDAAGADAEELAVLLQQQASLDPAHHQHMAYAYDGYSYVS